jgi:AraC-like DNA-binding protein
MIYFDKDNLHTDQYGKIEFSKVRGMSHDISFYHAKGRFGTVDIKEINANEFDICEFSLDTSEALDITSLCRDGLGLTIPVKRYLQYYFEELDAEVLLLLHYNLAYAPRLVKGTYTFPRGRYTIFSIRFSDGYLLKWNERVFSSFLDKAQKERPTVLCHHLPATGEMMFIINELFLERPSPEIYRYTKDTEGTIEDIAKAIGMNSLKLKQGFKKRYGTTIFAYITKLRMEKAKSLLMNSKLDVRQIASDVSYRHLSNFSNAFKRSFGYAPTVFREDKIISRSAQEAQK